MTARISLASGSNWISGEALTPTDLNDSFNYIVTVVNASH